EVAIEAGNPADAERFLPMLERHIARQGTPPRQTATDGGYASLDNLKQARALGVQDVAFHKKRALTIDAMVKSRWVYRKLKNFRAGIEALPETSFWSRPLHLARARSPQGVRLVISRRLQPCPVRTPQARIARQRTLLQHRHRPLPFRFYARQTILTPLTATETRDRCQSASQASRLIQFNSANTLTTVLKNCSLWTDTSLAVRP